MGPEDPFARLAKTHRRIEEYLDLLERAAAAANREDLREVVDFFQHAATRHHEDEEQSLFPRLRAVPELAAVLEALEREHAAHDELHGALADLVERDPLEPERLATTAKRIGDEYRAHIRHEEDDLFPAAERLLDPETRAEIGREMIARRGGGGGHGRGGGRRG